MRAAGANETLLPRDFQDVDKDALSLTEEGHGYLFPLESQKSCHHRIQSLLYVQSSPLQIGLASLFLHFVGVSNSLDLKPSKGSKMNS